MGQGQQAGEQGADTEGRCAYSQEAAEERSWEEEAALGRLIRKGLDRRRTGEPEMGHRASAAETAHPKSLAGLTFARTASAEDAEG